MFFDQTFAYADLGIVALLVLLEGVLSIDNALVLGILAKRLPKSLQQRALTYGLVGAFVFRVMAIFLAAYLLSWWVIKLIGGGYLLYIAIKHFVFPGHDGGGGDGSHEPHIVATAEGHAELRSESGQPLSREEEQAELENRSPIPQGHPSANLTAEQMTPMLAATPKMGFGGVPVGLGRKFWGTVLVIELTDIAFAVDSILAAIGTIPVHTGPGTNPKLWIVIAGGIIGLVLMRFAAVLFIKLLDKFPRFGEAAYLLVALIGLKLVLDWAFNKPPADRGPEWHAPLDFHFHTWGSPASILFWGLMLAFFCYGFLPPSSKKRSSEIPPAAAH